MANKKGLVQQVADSIYQMILTEKKYNPGDRLPGENILAAQLNVGRSTLREAIRILVSQGILVVYRGKGTFINMEITAFQNLGLESMERIRVRLKDLYETRLLFEPDIAALACRRATDEDMNNILSIGKSVEDAILAGHDRTKLDQKFHGAIVKASHNDFLQQLLPLIEKGVRDSITLNNGCHLPSEDILAKDTLTDHALIMEFIKARDASGAKNAMSIHLHHAITHLSLNIGEEPIF